MFPQTGTSPQVSLEFINRYFYYNIQPLTSEVLGASSKVKCV
jgi:hypothetical protein